MAPFTAWLPARPNQDFDLVVKIAGIGSSALIEEFAAIGRGLTDRGLDVMAQVGRPNDGSGGLTLRLRLASRPFHSIGHDFDILVYLGDQISDFRQYGLQRGTVLVWEPPKQHRLQLNMPDGVIVYPVPLTDLATQSGEGMAGRGLASLGVLLQLFGFPEASLAATIASVSRPRSLEAGFRFAQHVLPKRDIYSLPPATPLQKRIMLNPHQAVMLGFAVSHCGCSTECDEELKRSPIEWITRHVTVADGMVSLLYSETHPEVQTYRGPQGNVLALLRGSASATPSCLCGHTDPRIFVAADVPDALRLLVEGHHLIQLKQAGIVGVMIEDGLAARYQSVEVARLAEIVRGREGSSVEGAGQGRCRRTTAMAEHDGTYGATVGYVAWGTAQGVVRDAVALCRGFGLNVAALYPKIVLPFPTDELESFARTVTRVVIVESGQTSGFADRVRATCSFQPGLIRPEPEKLLSPMDIFLREGLGVCG